jgi:hypothetical protein
LSGVKDSLALNVEKISGNAVLDPKGPYALSILDQLKTLDKDKIGYSEKTKRNRSTLPNICSVQDQARRLIGWFDFRT